MLVAAGVEASTDIRSAVIPLKLPFLKLNLVDVVISVVPALQVSIFIFLGSPLLSVQNKRLSIMLIPVIILPKNFKNAFEVPAFASTAT